MKSPGAIKGLLVGFQRRSDECRWKMQKFMKGYLEYQRQPPESRGRYQEFHRFHRRIQYIRPVVVGINLLCWYFIIHHLGSGFGPSSWRP